MSYQPGTILKRRVEFEEPAEGKPDLRPYNEVEVIGQSPVQTAVRESEWTGQSGDSISVRPTSFGQVIDRPFGELQRDYEVVSIPERKVIDRQVVEQVEPGPSPEEVFQREAVESGQEAKRRDVPPDPNAPSPEDVFAAATGSDNRATMDTSVQRPEGA